MMPLPRQPHRPRAGKANRPFARQAEERMRGVERRQLGDIAFDRPYDRRPQFLDLRFDPPEQYPVRLGAAAHRLLQRLMRCIMERAEHLGEAAERRQQLFDIELADQSRSPLRPRPALVVSHPPRSEEHTSELQSQMRISYAVFCLKKKK